MKYFSDFLLFTAMLLSSLAILLVLSGCGIKAQDYFYQVKGHAPQNTNVCLHVASEKTYCSLADVNNNFYVVMPQTQNKVIVSTNNSVTFSDVNNNTQALSFRLNPNSYFHIENDSIIMNLSHNIEAVDFLEK